MSANIAILSGNESSSIWETIAAFYHQFAIDEGANCHGTATDFQHAVMSNALGYRLALIDKVGFIAWTDFPHGSEILDLFVSSTHRRQGLAQWAVQWLIKRQKRVPLSVDVSQKNQAAQILYTQLGFKKQNAQLFFDDTKKQGSQNALSLTMFDAESRAWMPATWPNILAEEGELYDALIKGARRFWVQQGTKAYRISLEQFSYHPQALRFKHEHSHSKAMRKSRFNQHKLIC